MSDMIDEATAKNSAGVHWDQAKFEAAKDNNGCISSEQFEKEALQLQLEIRNQQSQTLEKSMEGTFHRRELKAPAIAFSSSEGTQLFREALKEGFIENYFFLSEQFTTQAHPAYCGIGSLSMALNTLLIDPKRKWQGVWRWFDDEMLDCCELLDTIKEKGITLHKLACVATCNGADVHLHYGPDLTVEEFRRLIQISCSRCCGVKTVLIASYARGVLNQTGTGHFSPIGGYNAAQDMVLIMDVARFKYPPHWVPLVLLHEGLQALDPDSGKPRGILEVAAASEGALQKRMLSCCCLGNGSQENSCSSGSSGSSGSDGSTIGCGTSCSVADNRHCFSGVRSASADGSASTSISTSAAENEDSPTIKKVKIV